MTQRKGYAGQMLRVDLSSGAVGTMPTEAYTERYLGGRGIAAAVHWEEVPPEVGAFDPENRLVISTGPLCGVPGFAGSRWMISGKSPVHNRFSYCNLGGNWGAKLKFAGYDGLVVEGKAEKLVTLTIDGDKVSLKDAAHMRGKGAIETREALKEEMGKSFSVLAVGAAGENGVVLATLTADMDSSGSSGMGATMGVKNLKAVCVRGEGKIEIADPDRARQLRKRIKEIKQSFQPWPSLMPQERVDKEVCLGCINGCVRSTFTPQKGKKGKYYCQSSMFYEVRAQRYYGEINDVPYIANKLCDEYGMDTRAVETMIMWLSRCYRANILTEEETGLPFSKLGSQEFIETFMRKVATREGIGDVLANGTIKAAELVGQGSEKLITDYMVSTGENELYGPRLYITTGMFYAMEPRQPIQQLHEISALCMMWANPHMALKDNYLTADLIRRIADRFWGGEMAGDFSTYEGKALAAAKIQDRQYAKESLIICDMSWPILHSPTTEDHLGDPTLESQVCEAVTGMDVDEKGLYKIGERVLNLQRAVLAREGDQGREHDTLDEFNFTAPLKGDFGNPECLVPGREGEPFSRKGLVVERDQFEKMKDEYYGIRGWDVSTGLQRKEQLEALGMDDVAEDLGHKGLLA
ncbi:aldehyde ferredoxin oxidoreductase N-terminal domain-containing protein [Thermodesulfobacteriota bacterium]